MAESTVQAFKSKRDLWIKCLDGDDRHSIMRQIYHMIWNTAAFRVINEARRIAPKAPQGGVQLNQLMHTLINDGFFEGQMLAIRRLTDNYPITGDGRGYDVFSLTSLLEDMRKNANLLTRSNIFEAESLEYDVAKVHKQEVLYEEAEVKKGNLTFSTPKNLDSQLLEERHAQIDFLAGVTAEKRAPSDSVRPLVLERLKDFITASSRDLHTHVDKFVAHAASPESRQAVRADEALITLNHLYEAHATVCKVANFVDAIILRSQGHGFLPMPQFDQFEFIEKPLVTVEGVKAMRRAWGDYLEETQLWSLWGIQDFRSQFEKDFL